jgi:hypothetical protein
MNIKQSRIKKPDVHINKNEKIRVLEASSKDNNIINEYLNSCRGFFNYSDKSICLNLFVIDEDTQAENDIKNINMSFEESVCQTISHEYMHYILDREQSVQTSRRYDRIKQRLRNDGYMA